MYFGAINADLCTLTPDNDERDERLNVAMVLRNENLHLFKKEMK